MSLYKRGGVWWYKFKFQGQTIRESTHSGSKEIARTAERDRHRDLERGINRIADREPMPLLRVASERWLAEKAGRAPKTIAGYKQRKAAVVAALGDKLVCDISRNDILEYRAKRLADGFSPRTVNYEMGCLRGILDSYGLWGSVSRKVKRLKENHDIGQAMSYVDEDKLRTLAGASLSPSLLPLFVLAIDTGLRAAELQSLRRKDLALTIANGTITSGEAIVPKSKTEAGKGRSVPLTARACAVLTTWLDRFSNASAESYVFPRHSIQMLKGGKLTVIRNIRLSEPVQSWQRAWRKILKDAGGLKYRWHDLRHTFVTRLAENPNVSEETIRALAGHVSKEMLQRYSHIRVRAKKEAILALERSQVENLAGGGTKMGTISTEQEQPDSQVTEKNWLPPRDSNPDMLIQSQLSCR